MKSRVCFVHHRCYSGDPVLENPIQALLDAGYDVDVLAVRRSGEPYKSIEQGVRVYRLPSLVRKGGNKLRYVVEHSTFLLSCFLFLALLQLRRRYSLVHVFSLPDFLVFAALIPKALGAKIILHPSGVHT